MNGNYLIPANSKKSMLIFGVFTQTDLILFASGVSLTLLLLVIFKTTNLGLMMLIIAPAGVASLLVAPVPNYHNVLQLLKNINEFFTKRRRYVWKGWGLYENDK